MQSLKLLIASLFVIAVLAGCETATPGGGIKQSTGPDPNNPQPGLEYELIKFEGTFSLFVGVETVLDNSVRHYKLTVLSGDGINDTYQFDSVPDAIIAMHDILDTWEVDVPQNEYDFFEEYITVNWMTPEQFNEEFGL